MNDAHADRLDRIRLARTDGIGPINFGRLMSEYPSAREAIEALPERMRRAGREGPPPIPSRAAIEEEIAATEKLGGRMLVLGDADYPLMLGHIPDPPPVLSILGQAGLLSVAAIGIVGARNASAAGLRIAEGLGAEAVEAGLCVVSGLARGIDAAAHRAALTAGLTVAAIAGGLDRVYPYEHTALQAEIAERGCVVTEAPLGTAPLARHFPKRNRVIAGLSLGSVIIEAAEQSGTLITARLALEYHREVFAVPGSPLDARSRGGNRLIRDGAVLTESFADIRPHLPASLPEPASRSRAANPGFAEPARGWNGGAPPSRAVMDAVLSLLSPVPVAVDELVCRCQFSVSAVMAALSELELGGLAMFLPGGQVVCAEVKGPKQR